tara:strand:- start:3936 stop:4307 length:372 start_codon:yes stop_codon:yes gene_type:complete
MSKLDDAIHNALTEEDAEFLAKFESEPSSVRQMVGVFSGPLSWFHLSLLVGAIIIIPFVVFAIYQFSLATQLRPLLYWGTAIGISFLILVVIRLQLFMQLHTNRIMRELKRLELQIARQSSKV